MMGKCATIATAFQLINLGLLFVTWGSLLKVQQRANYVTRVPTEKKTKVIWHRSNSQTERRNNQIVEMSKILIDGKNERCLNCKEIEILA